MPFLAAPPLAFTFCHTYKAANMQSTMMQRSQTRVAGATKGPAPARVQRLAQAPRRSTAGRAAAVQAPAEVSVEQINRCVNAIRFLAIDAVNKAKSGHPGLPMGCAPMTYMLFNEAMKYNPKDPKWFNRDRFVLSAGHGSMLQYALLHLVGYDSVSVRGQWAPGARAIGGGGWR